MPRLTRRLRNSAFVRNVAVLFSGKAAAAAVSLLFVPLIARVFEPAHYGAATLLLAVAALIAIAGALGFDKAIVIAASDRDAAGLVVLGGSAAAGLTAVLLSALAVTEITAGDVGGRTALGPWIWLLPWVVAMFAAIDVLEHWSTRHKRFRRIAAATFAGALAVSVSRLALGIGFGSAVIGLLVGSLLGLGTRLAALLPRQQIFASPADRPSGGDLRRLFARYAAFPAFNVPSALLLQLNRSLPLFAIGALFGGEALGFFAMADRTVRTAVMLASDAIRRVYLQKAAELRRKGTSPRRVFIEAFLGMSAIGLPPTILMMLFGAPAFEVLLGERWSGAGTMVEILAPLLFAWWISTPASALYIAYEKQKLWLAIQAVSTAVFVGVFAAAHAYDLPQTGALRLYVAAGCISQATIVAIVWLKGIRTWR